MQHIGDRIAHMHTRENGLRVVDRATRKREMRQLGRSVAITDEMKRSELRLDVALENPRNSFFGFESMTNQISDAADFQSVRKKLEYRPATIS